VHRNPCACSLYALLRFSARIALGRGPQIHKGRRGQSPYHLARMLFQYKIQTLVLGSAIAALSRSLLAFYLQYINPMNFSLWRHSHAWIIVNNAGVQLEQLGRHNISSDPALGSLANSRLYLHGDTSYFSPILLASATAHSCLSARS